VKFETHFSVVLRYCSDRIYNPIYCLCPTAAAVDCSERVNAVKKCRWRFWYP